MSWQGSCDVIWLGWLGLLWWVRWTVRVLRIKPAQATQLQVLEYTQGVTKFEGRIALLLFLKSMINKDLVLRADLQRHLCFSSILGQPFCSNAIILLHGQAASRHPGNSEESNCHMHQHMIITGQDILPGYCQASQEWMDTNQIQHTIRTSDTFDQILGLHLSDLKCEYVRQSHHISA